MCAAIMRSDRDDLPRPSCITSINGAACGYDCQRTGDQVACASTPMGACATRFGVSALLRSGARGALADGSAERSTRRRCERTLDKVACGYACVSTLKNVRCAQTPWGSCTRSFDAIACWDPQFIALPPPARRLRRSRDRPASRRRACRGRPLPASRAARRRATRVDDLVGMQRSSSASCSVDLGDARRRRWLTAPSLHADVIGEVETLVAPAAALVAARRLAVEARRDLVVDALAEALAAADRACAPAARRPRARPTAPRTRRRSARRCRRRLAAAGSVADRRSPTVRWLAAAREPQRESEAGDAEDQNAGGAHRYL